MNLRGRSSMLCTACSIGALTITTIRIPVSRTLLVVQAGASAVAAVSIDGAEQTRLFATRKHPQDIVVSSSGDVTYVAEMGDEASPGDTIAVFGLPDGELRGRIDLGAHTRPHLLAVSRRGNLLWVATAPSRSIVEIDTTRNVVSRVWDTTQAGPYTFVVTPNDEKIFAANFDAGTISVIRRLDGAVNVIRVGGRPIGIDVSPNGREVWVSSLDTGTITVLDVQREAILATIDAVGSGLSRLKFTRDGRRVWGTDSGKDSVVVLDSQKRRPLASIQTGRFPKGLLLDDAGQRAFVSLMGDAAVAVFDLGTFAETGRLPTGPSPEGLALTRPRQSHAGRHEPAMD